MTKVYGKLFSDGRSGVLAVKPSRPFFGVSRDERHYEVSDGCIDLDLYPTPSGIYYQIGFKDVGDVRRTDFTLNWRIPDVDSFEITPGASARKKNEEQSNAPKASVYERVQLKRVANELSDSISESDKLSSQLLQSELEVDRLKGELAKFKTVTNAVLSDRDQTIAQLSEQSAPVVRTVYRETPVPPEPLQRRIQFLEQENQRLVDLNTEYYKSVVELHQLQLDKAQSTPKQSPVEFTNSPQQRLLRKLLGK